jgi:YVTN family beta-propeller protein
MMNRVIAPPAPARDSTHHRFRLAVVAASAVAAIVGSVLLATHHSGGNVTTRGVTATLHVPGHPGWVAVGRDALWLSLSDTRTPVRDRPLLRLDLASGTVERRILVGGEASYLAHVGNRLLASVAHTGSSGSGPSLIVALDWRSGRVLVRRQFLTPMGPLVASGKDLWALQIKPAALLRLDPLTLAPTAPPLPLSTGRALGVAAAGGSVWATASDAAEVLRINATTRSITRTHVGGFPVGIAVERGSVWFANPDRGEIGRLDPMTLQPVGTPMHIGGQPVWLARAGGDLFVGDASEGTVKRIDIRSGKEAGPAIRVASPAKDSPPLVIVPSGGSIWAGSFASNTLTRVSATSRGNPALALSATGAQTATTDTRALPRGARVVARIPLGNGAPAPLGGGAFTVGEGAVWAMSDVESTLMRIDPARNAVVARIKVSVPGAAAAGDGGVWLAYPGQDTVSRIDPATNKIRATIHVGPQPVGIAVSPGAVWVVNAGGPSISRIDPVTERVVATIRVGPKLACCSEHFSLTAAHGAVWVGVPNENRIVRIDVATNRVISTTKLPYPPCAFLAADASALWSTGGGCADVVARIDPHTKKLTVRQAELHPVGLAVAFGSVWVAVLGASNVDQIDPHTGRLVARLPIVGAPVRLAVGFGSVWVNDDNGRVLRIQPQR